MWWAVCCGQALAVVLLDEVPDGFSQSEAGFAEEGSGVGEGMRFPGVFQHGGLDVRVVFPLDDVKNHVLVGWDEGVRCWCGPREEFQEGGGLVVEHWCASERERRAQ